MIANTTASFQCEWDGMNLSWPAYAEIVGQPAEIAVTAGKATWIKPPEGGE